MNSVGYKVYMSSEEKDVRLDQSYKWISLVDA